MHIPPEEMNRIAARLITVLAEEKLTVAEAEYVLSYVKRTVADITTVQPATKFSQSPE